MHMKLRKSDFTGTGKVFRFTLVQMLKGKANIITMLIFFLFAAGSIPVMTLMMGGEQSQFDEAEASRIAAVYVRNDTGYELDLESISRRDKFFSDTNFIDTDLMDVEWSEDTYESMVEPAEAYIHLQKDTEKMNFTIGAYALEDKEFTDGDLDSCAALLGGILDEARYAQQNVAPEQIAALTSPYETKSGSVSEYLEEKEDDFDTRFGVQMIYSVALLILCTFVSSFIIQKVIEEKASKLAELLMVSVSPLAMLVGKILAVMTYILGLVLSLAAVVGLSYVITGRFADTSVLYRQIAESGISMETLQVSPVTALILVVSLLLGYLQVSLISGLVGTECSTTEDVEPANMAVVLLVMAGYMIATVAAGVGSNPVLATVISLCPITSMFCAPVRYIIGDIGFGMLALSWVIQFAVIVVLAYVCARIYRALMMYRGNRMKLSGWITMFRQSSAKEVENR
jgi:ABC-2 type transport system permease protein